MSQRTLFERIGGMKAVNAAVEIFYQKVLADKSICDYFAKTDMKTQISKQKAFLAYAFGGPITYAGQTMRNAHAKMNLNEAHFNAVTSHLVASLEELNVAQDIIDEVLEIVKPTKDDILNT